jgi:hypothetical protein
MRMIKLINSKTAKTSISAALQGPGRRRRNSNSVSVIGTRTLNKNPVTGTAAARAAVPHNNKSKKQTMSHQRAPATAALVACVCASGCIEVLTTNTSYREFRIFAFRQCFWLLGVFCLRVPRNIAKTVGLACAGRVTVLFTRFPSSLITSGMLDQPRSSFATPPLPPLLRRHQR